ncbi:uncharacterized protein K444DRAFT_628926 [Hyaloscypha bicolor E]|uniref:Roadblock/LAMTOR2 domain-containing protein n=1 Tax=Hyaloscypha bicolor E TaxID=1095630 RepID=A0A2J6TD08_9HELO|nr:uncharacterized protein K444DRAFT_628926 [Hyaloscypha bicolor E]PMD60900.1 hypothetical protein K444DRAFT_628926 [Hyaloscypha bicolor E]
MSSNSIISSSAEDASSHFSHTLERLSSKPGVVASLVIDRASNALLKSTGTFSFWSASTSNSTQTAATNASSTPSTATETPSTDSTSQFASTIIGYVDSTGALVQHMDSEDDLKLLRVRTKKHEIVIVPDSKFIFVVVHEISS